MIEKDVETILEEMNMIEKDVETILEEMNEPRPLPMGRTEFGVWADRIISGAMVSANIPSQKYALANLILHLGPTESHKPDAFFIHSLRKLAANQVADVMRHEFFAEAKRRTAEEEESQRLLKAVPDPEPKTTAAQ